MDITELLDELRSNMLRDVSDLETTDDAELQASYLWSDDTLVRYINQGYFRLAKLAYLIRDKSTPSVCEITLTSDGEYTLDPKVTAVYSAQIGNRYLQRSSHSPLTGANSDIAFQYPSEMSERPGNPWVFTTDEENGILRISPTPASEFVGSTLLMRVARLPMEKLALPAEGDEPMVPEIREEYHMHILEWAAWLALRNNDTDAENLIRARSFRASFREFVEEAKNQHKRLLIQPPQFRVRARHY